MEAPRKTRIGQERIDRVCLNCDSPFKAIGKFNRICPKCTYNQCVNAIADLPQYRYLGPRREDEEINPMSGLRGLMAEEVD